jgi:hypothetical protein
MSKPVAHIRLAASILVAAMALPGVCLASASADGIPGEASAGEADQSPRDIFAPRRSGSADASFKTIDEPDRDWLQEAVGSSGILGKQLRISAPNDRTSVKAALWDISKKAPPPKAGLATRIWSRVPVGQILFLSVVYLLCLSTRRGRLLIGPRRLRRIGYMVGLGSRYRIETVKAPIRRRQSRKASAAALVVTDPGRTGGDEGSRRSRKPSSSRRRGGTRSRPLVIMAADTPSMKQTRAEQPAEPAFHRSRHAGKRRRRRSLVVQPR